MLPYPLHTKLCVRPFLALVLVFCFLTSEANVERVWAAQGRAVFSIQPVSYDPKLPITRSYFIFNATPGVHLESRVRVSNIGTVEGSADLYGVDATTGQTSGAVYLARTEPRQDVGAWLTLGRQHLTLKAGESEIVSFQLALPHDVRSGQHVGGIVVENKDIQKPSDSKALQISMRNLTIMAVQVNLPGPPIYQLEATGIEPGGAHNYQALVMNLRNTGTMMLWPTGTLRVIDPASGNVVRSIKVQLDTFLPQTAIGYPVYIAGKALNIGNYQAQIDLHYAGGTLLYKREFAVTATNIEKVFSSSSTIAPSPTANAAQTSSWQPLLEGSGIIVLGSILICFWLIGWRRKRKKEAEEKEQNHAST